MMGPKMQRQPAPGGDMLGYLMQMLGQHGQVSDYDAGVPGVKAPAGIDAMNPAVQFFSGENVNPASGGSVTPQMIKQLLAGGGASPAAAPVAAPAPGGDSLFAGILNGMGGGGAGDPMSGIAALAKLLEGGGKSGPSYTSGNMTGDGIDVMQNNVSGPSNGGGDVMAMLAQVLAGR